MTERGNKNSNEEYSTYFRGLRKHRLTSYAMLIGAESGVIVGGVRLAEGNIQPGLASIAGALTLGVIEVIRSYNDGKK